MRSVHKTFLLASVAAALLGLNGSVFSQWSHDPSVNTPICTAPNSQLNPVSTTDGSGGSIIAWLDNRTNVTHIYAQRVNSRGQVQWTHDGVAICTAGGAGQSNPVIVSDNSGGAIIAWPDARSGTNYDIYAQRINGAGTVQWTTDGIAICTASIDQNPAVIVSDDSGGAIIAWTDDRNGNDDIYAQRINHTGTVLWAFNGVSVCTYAYNQFVPAAVSDGAGGAIITWQDYRSATNLDLYAQRITSAGIPLWTTNGVPISIASGDQASPVIATDDSGGAIISWSDARVSASDIYAQRVNGLGAVQWATDGVVVCQATNYQQNPVIVSDNSGGAIIAWSDQRNGLNFNVYSQRMSGAGVALWLGDGIPVCTAVNNKYYLCIAPDASGGAIIAWEDAHNGLDFDIYAQRISADGSGQWPTNGVPISTSPGNQLLPTAVGDGTGGAILGWFDDRSGIFHIYAQRVDNIGYLGYNNPQLSFVKDVPGDQGGKVNVAFDASSYDQYPNEVISSYSVWRGVSSPADVPSNASGVFKSTSGKTYRRIPGATGTTYWEMVGSITSHYLPSYNYTAQTQSDSTQTGLHMTKFFVSAQTWNQYVFWDSNIDSGYSVDNLPPGAVQSVTAQSQTSSVLVHWSPDVADSDVGYYEVHRSTTSGFTPGPSTKIGQTADTSLVDGSPVSTMTNYYRIVTIDIHGNKSAPSPQAAAGTLSTQSYSLNDKWNMVSVPLLVNNFSKTSLFPTAASVAFAFQGSYVPQTSLANGVGYWLFFNGAQNVSMTGFFIDHDTVHVNAGWNMIGSVSSPVTVANITSVPGGIVTSPFFGFNGAYLVSSTIDPGKAYWVKVNQNGSLILSTSSAQSAEDRIVITPVSELPPPPPDASASGMNAGTPNEFSLAQNYPNPFNPSTEIAYQLPEPGWVTLKVYNMLGQEVSTLVNQYQDAGYKSVTVNMNTLPSGIYAYRITAGTFTGMKKMILLK